MNKLSPIIQSVSPVQQSSPQSSPVIRYDHEPPPGKNIAITVVSEVTTVFNKVLKMFHVVLECPNSFNSSVFRFCFGEGRGRGRAL